MKEYNDFKNGSVLSKSKEKKFDNKGNALTSMFESLSDKTKDSIMEINDETKKLEKNKKTDKLYLETRKNQWFILTKKLKNSIETFKRLQVDKNKIDKEKIKNTILLIDPEISNQNLEKINEEGLECFKTKENQNSDNNRRLLKNAKKRNNNVLKIAQSVAKLVKLLKDLEDMIFSAKDEVEEISYNMEKSEIFSKKGVDDLEQALEYQKKAMWIKRLIWSVLSLFFGGTLIFLSIIFIVPALLH